MVQLHERLLIFSLFYLESRFSRLFFCLFGNHIFGVPAIKSR